MRFLRFVCSFPPTQSGLFPPLFSSPLRAHLNLIFLFPHLLIFIRFLFVNLVLLPAPYSHTHSLSLVSLENGSGSLLATPASHPLQTSAFPWDPVPSQA